MDNLIKSASMGQRVNPCESKLVDIEGLGTIGVFPIEGTAIVNTTPHPITFMDSKGELLIIPSSCILNAKAVETNVNLWLVKTDFVGDDNGYQMISNIRDAYSKSGRTEEFFIVGSMIAAQAYKGDVVAMTPCAGYERVAPAEKRMNCNKFTIFM